MQYSLGSVSLTQLLYAVAVDTHQKFGRAAEACHVTQPTLSMQLAKLERELGMTLFDRSRTPVVATDDGKRVLDQAHKILRETSRLVEMCHAVGGIVAGEVRIGVIPTIAPYLLPRIVSVLSTTYPRLELVVEERQTADIVEGLRADTLDAGIVATSIGASGITERPLYVEPFVAYVGRQHRLAHKARIAPSDLSLDDLWLLSEGHCFRTQTIALCADRAGDRSVRRTSLRDERAHHQGTADACTTGMRFESGNLETLKRLVDRGLGMTLLPALAAADMVGTTEAEMIRPFSKPVPTRVVRVIRRRTHLRQHLVDAVVNTISDVIGNPVIP